MTGQYLKKVIYMAKVKQETPKGDAAFIAEAVGLPSPGSQPAPTPGTPPGAVNYQDFIVDFTKPAPAPEFLLEIDGVGVMPAGGITVVTGEKKCGKTQFLAAVTACLISGRDFGRMKRRQAPGKILWIDTEQSAYDIHNAIGRVYHLAGIPQGQPSEKHGLTVLQTRAISPEQRRQVVEAAATSIQPDLLIIDGVRDLLHDFNDVTETGLLLDWIAGAMTARPGMRVAVVLHTNPGSYKMRGHLGTELGNKFSDQFTCSKENGTFSVEHESRGRQVLTPFIFRIDETGQLSTSTVEQRAGVVDADATLARIIPPEGMEFNEIVKAYAKTPGLNEKKAREALKARLNANPPTLIKRDGLFFLETPFDKQEDKPCPF